MDATDKELILELFQKIVNLQINLTVYRDLLQRSNIQSRETGLKLNWQDAVAAHRQKIDSNSMGTLYSDIEERLTASTPLSSESIRLLIALAESPLEPE